MTNIEEGALEEDLSAMLLATGREATFNMNNAGIQKPTSAPASSYDHLLAAAQWAQAGADRAVADLAAVKRTMTEAPRVLELRRNELAKAQSALSAAENDYVKAREQVAARQNEAARLIEAAADAQRALAQALITQDIPVAPAAMEALSTRLAQANAQTRTFSPPPSPATLGRNRYTPTPPMHPADLHYEVVEYLSQRDALCPSCGHSLRAVQAAHCPGCKLQLSLKVLYSVRAHISSAPRAIWFVRALCAFAFILSAYLAYVTISGGRPIGCGGGSGCDIIMRSAWSKLMGLPVALYALPLFAAIFLTTFFQRVGLTDTFRQRSWSLLTALAMIAGITSLWFIAAQIIVFKSLCPHCLLVQLASLTIAAILLLKAPLRRPEKLPEPAIGRIRVPRRALIIATTIALLVSLGFGTLHATLSSRQGPIDRNRILGIPDKPENHGGGLLMKGLEGLDTPQPPIKSDAPAPSNITPGSDDSPSHNNNTKTPQFPQFDSTPESKLKSNPAKYDESAEAPPQGLLLKGLELPPEKPNEKK